MRWLVFVLVMIGCTQSPEDRAQIVCTTFCDCIVGTGVPAQVQACVDQQCLPALPAGPAVSDACMSCVYAHESTCSVLLDQCESMCF